MSCHQGVRYYCRFSNCQTPGQEYRDSSNRSAHERKRHGGVFREALPDNLSIINKGWVIRTNTWHTFPFGYFIFHRLTSLSDISLSFKMFVTNSYGERLLISRLLQISSSEIDKVSIVTEVTEVLMSAKDMEETSIWLTSKRSIKACFSFML